MRRFKLLAAALLALGLMALPAPSFAAQQYMCRPAAPGTAAGPARWTAPGSGTVYNLDLAGCANIAAADFADAAAGGLVQVGFLRTLVYTTGVLTGTTDVVPFSLPAGAYIQQIIYANTTANAITGGITVGTTANGTDVATATTCGANCLAAATDAQLAKRALSATDATPLHFAAATAWNNANVTITLIYGFF